MEFGMGNQKDLVLDTTLPNSVEGVVAALMNVVMAASLASSFTTPTNYP
jgi:hypothetical protein